MGNRFFRKIKASPFLARVPPAPPTVIYHGPPNAHLNAHPNALASASSITGSRAPSLRHQRLLSIALPVLLSAAGCASFGPDKPPSEVPALAATAAPRWFAALPHEGRLADLSAWWAQLDDPLLVELIDASQSVSPTLASALSRIEQARAARVAADAALLPTLSGFGAAQRSNTQSGVPQAVTTAQLGLQTAWELDVFGGNRQAASAAAIRLRNAQVGWHDARVSVAAETANSYAALRTCEQLLAVAGNDARSRSESSRLTDLSTRAGFSAPATAALARASAAEAAARLTQQRAACDTEVKTLVALTGLPEPELRRRLGGSASTSTSQAQGQGQGQGQVQGQVAAAGTSASAPAPGYAESSASAVPLFTSAAFAVDELPAQVLAQRPDIYLAELEIAAASSDIGVARADRFPRLSLSGSIAAGAVRLAGETSRLSTWSIGPLSLSVPLLDGGRGAANVKAAEARYEEAVALYGSRVRQAVREVESALVALDSARSRSGDARVASEGYRASFTATEARYRGGLASLVELEDARRSALASETALVSLQREQIGAWISLYRAAGGGWTRPAPSTPVASR